MCMYIGLENNWEATDIARVIYIYPCVSVPLPKSPPEKHGFHLRKSKKNRKSTQMHFLVWDW